MKKLSIIIGVFALALVALAWPSDSYSQATLSHPEASECSEAYTNGIEALEAAWESNLNTIAQQEKATSKTVDEAFESLRTYRCWLDYMCRAVNWSGGQNRLDYARNYDEAIPLGSFHLGNIPGCVDADDLVLPAQWQVDFHESISGHALYLEPTDPSKFTAIPQCISGDTGITTEDLITSNANFAHCKKAVEARFGTEATEVDSSDTPPPTALLKVQNTLMSEASNKKARGVESKLIEIIRRLKTSQFRAQQFKQNFTELLKRMPCILDQCT